MADFDPFETFACDDMKVRNWRSLLVQVDKTNSRYPPDPVL
jgi:hypothetical protein